MVEGLSDTDPNSFSHPETCSISDMQLNVDVDFEKEILSGYVDITVEKKEPKVESVFLDTRDLVIKSIRNKNSSKKMMYTLSDPVANFGSKLEIKLPRSTSKRSMIRIEYETSPQASALQWLEPSQTAGKKHPYMFSQCQAIHARSMFPCQDTPYVKFTYSATITAPPDLVVLMSALRNGEELSGDGQKRVFKFSQKIPIPSYLIAIVVGALESRELGPRSHVWSEKEYVDKALHEFSETENMIKVAEELLGPYVWEVYDLLVLPPSFPFGGMENPCLTFVTPTLLAGDKSLADVVAHEIAHSWTGNLVTNNNFQHFWLNEGFTVFVERKIIGRMHGESHRHFEALGGWKELEYTIQTREVDDPLTKLVPDLKGVDPDDAFSTVPYEKGHTFLYYLEETLGGAEVFEEFLRKYVEKYKYKSIDTDEWKNFLYEHFSDKKDVLDGIDWNAWLYTPGMPPLKPEYDTTLGDKCVSLCDLWCKAEKDFQIFSLKDIEEMNSPQVREFLALLLQKEPLSDEKMQKLTEVYNFEKVMNSEIRFRWLRLGVRSHWKPIIPHAIKFVNEQGRMKFVRPLYRDMYDWEETRDLAITNYREHLDEMMYVTAHTVGKDLHLDESSKN